MWMTVCWSGGLGDKGGRGAWLWKNVGAEALSVFSFLGESGAVGREEPSAEQGGKAPESRWRPTLTIKAGPVREAGGIVGLRLWAHHLIDLEDGVWVTSLPSHSFGSAEARGEQTDRQTDRDSHQREAQSCPGPVDSGQLLSQCRGHGASQVGWGEDRTVAAGALIASRRSISG